MGGASTHRRRVVWLAGVLVLVLPDCAGVLGLDEYEHGQPLPGVAACGEAEVLSDGRCTRVGVPESECGAGFAADGRGGCVAVLPEGSCLGALARPGDTTCVAVATCDAAPPIAAEGSSLWYVDAAAHEAGSGTAARPYRTLNEAIEASRSESAPTLVVAPGEYHESLVVDHALRIVGTCPEQTRLAAMADDQPALTITEAAHGTRITGMHITGGNTGVRIDGAAGIEIQHTRVADVDGPGIDVDGGSGGADVAVADSLIEHARGAGIRVYGGTLSVTGSTIRSTHEPEAGQDACGICMRASGRVPLIDDTIWDARGSIAGALEVVGSLIEGNAGTGVSIIGVRDATIERSVVRAGASRSRIGIDVEERTLGNLPAALHVKQTLVQETQLVGIRARNASVNVERSSVRDIGGAADPGNHRCLGNGVRVLWDREPDKDASPALRLSESAIDRTHETGVLIDGAVAQLSRAIVRDTRADGCASDLGDGVAAYAHDFASAALELRESRVENSARAPVASFGGAAVSLRSSVLLGTRAAAMHDVTLDHSYCELVQGERWAECDPRNQMLVPALLGGAGCDPDDATVCIDACYLDSGNPPTEFGTVLVPELRVWILDHDEIVPARGDHNGCAQLEGLPRNARMLRAIAVNPSTGSMHARAPAAYVPTLAPIDTSLGDSTFRLRLAGPLPYAVAGSIEALSMRDGDVPLDLRSAAVFSVGVCVQHPADRPAAADSCRSFENQLAGVSVALDSGGRAYYPRTIDAVDDTATATLDGQLGSLALFVNVAPGERQIALSSADPTRRLDCTSDTGVGWRGAEETAAQNVFRVTPRPGFLYGATIFCDPIDSSTAKR